MENISRPARHLPQSEFVSRTAKLCALLKRLKLDALFIQSAVNRYYFTGFNASNGVVLAERGEQPLFFTDFRYLTAARKAIGSMPSHLLWKAEQHREVLTGLGSGWRRVGFESRQSADSYLRLKEALPQCDLVDIDDELVQLRAVKSRAEQKLMRAACCANDSLFEAVTTELQRGMSEWEISTIIRNHCLRLGQGAAFDPIVCVGRNAAECHHHPDSTKWNGNSALLMDFGVKLDGYCSDMTRTVHHGRAGALFGKIYNLVLDANRRVIDALRPGMRCCDADLIARQHIERAGYGKFFDHGLGHGLGLEVHEHPSLSPNCRAVLKPGMVVTVEPGIYLPNRLGVRIEDVVLITKNGCDLLSSASRSFVG